MADIHVESLHSYPIKSCAPIDLETVGVEPEGLQYDREWVIARMREKGTKFLSQRDYPALSLVQTDIAEQSLHISAEGFGAISIPLDPTEMAENPVHEIDIFDKPGTGRDQGNEPAEFFTDYLQAHHPKGSRIEARLLRAETRRVVNPKYAVRGMNNTIKFSDGSSILLASTASLEELNTSSTERLAMPSFRPNIVVSGANLYPYAEDTWERLVIGDMGAVVAWPCERCPMPNIDQKVGILPPAAKRAATIALKATRTGVNPLNGREASFFGVNLVHYYEPGLKLNVGDKLRVASYLERPSFDPIQG